MQVLAVARQALPGAAPEVVEPDLQLALLGEGDGGAPIVRRERERAVVVRPLEGQPLDVAGAVDPGELGVGRGEGVRTRDVREPAVVGEGEDAGLTAEG
jgi:hypothetical protein